MTIEMMIEKLELMRLEEMEENQLIERLKTEAEGIGSPSDIKDVVASSGNGDRMEMAVIKLSEVKEMIRIRRRNRFRFRSEAMSIMSRLDDEDSYIMQLYAINGMRQREIAEITGMSVGYVNQRITKSLQRLRDVLVNMD